jgi:hypothetical protein
VCRCGNGPSAPALRENLQCRKRLPVGGGARYPVPSAGSRVANHPVVLYSSSLFSWTGAARVGTTHLQISARQRIISWELGPGVRSFAPHRKKPDHFWFGHFSLAIFLTSGVLLGAKVNAWGLVSSVGFETGARQNRILTVCNRPITNRQGFDLAGAGFKTDGTDQGLGFWKLLLRSFRSFPVL